MTEILMIDVQEEHTLGIRRRVPLDELGAFFDSAFADVFRMLQEAGAHPTGAPFARYHSQPTTDVDVEAGFPVSDPSPVGGQLVAGTLPATRAVETIHVGAYDSLADTYERMRHWASTHHVSLLDEMWERYESGPASDPDPETWRTRVIWPVLRPQVEAHESQERAAGDR